MSDRLEDFVKQHREQFDLHEPSPSVWLKINPAGAPLEKERGTLRWLRVAAAVAVIFAGFTAGIYYLTGGNAGQDQYSSEQYEEIQETERYYNQMVSQRYQELESYLASDPAAREMLDADLEELDEVYKELKEDLNDNASNPEVVEAMILNYRVKLEILEDLLKQIKEKENQDEDDESHSL
jgi:hypothetical protein